MTVPGLMPEHESIENGPADQLKITHYIDHTENEDELSGNVLSLYDEIRFDESLGSSNFGWNADQGV